MLRLFLVGFLVAGCAIGAPAPTATPSPQAPLVTSAPTPLPSPAPTASPMPSATPAGEPSPSPAGGLRHLLLDKSLRITVTIPDSGWSGERGSGILVSDDSDGAGIIAFDEGEYFVYGDPCDWSSTRPNTPAATVEEIVIALTNQAKRDASAPENITVNGYSGKKIILHVPDDADFGACDSGLFGTLGVRGDDPARFAQGPGQIEEVWIVDVDGRVVLLDPMYFPAAGQNLVDELHTILESATFD